MIENEIQFHLAAVQGSLPLIQTYLQGANKVPVDCTDEVYIQFCCRGCSCSYVHIS